MSFYWLVIGILVVWRMTHLLYGEDGPWDVFVRMRRAFGDGFIGKLLDCFYCLSLWIALPLAFWLGTGWKERLLLWPALSGGAILFNRLTAKDEPPPLIVHTEQEEMDRVLREGQNPGASGGRERQPTAH